MKVEIIDLKKRFKDEEVQVLKCIKRVLKKGNLILTPEVLNFEKSVCKYTGSKYCLGLNSGTDALLMSLWCLGIKRGDEVITSPISFIASVSSIIHVGAKPVFVDIGEDLNMNPNLIEKAITNKTKAILPVHWTGRICDMDKICKIAKKYNLKVIEDSAQGMGAFYKKKHAGTFSDIAAFSTHPLKNLNGLGDGGFITTNKKTLYNKIKLYRNHGLKGRDNVEVIGVNSRLDSLNAEVLNYRLKKLNNVINKRQKNINLYKKLIKTKKVNIISENSDKKNANVMFIALCEKRDELQKYLKKFNVQALVYYKNLLYSHKATRYLNIDRKNFPVANSLVKKVLAFPHHQYLKRNEIEFVCKKINNFYKK